MAVMKKIASLTEIPRNEELKITERASKLMHQVLASSSALDPANFAVARVH